MNKKQKKVLVRILAAAALIALWAFLPLEGALRFALYMIPYAIIGYDILMKAAKGIKNRQPFDENFLMAVATLGAIVLGEYTEGVAVMLFYQIGELFQSYAVGKSRRSIQSLMDIRPDSAVLLHDDGTSETVDPDSVPVGSTILVSPGEKVSIDGIVLDGHSTLNTSALTGESLPREVSEGDNVNSGCVNLSGVLKIQTTKEFGDSTASKVLELMENASSRKSRQEDFITRFARVYTPAVCYSALALAILPPALRFMTGYAPNWGDWIMRALTFLVISCPCALVISVPLTFFAGIGGISKKGVLVKGSNYLEALSRVRTVVFDKTGTLTQGVFEVDGVHHAAMDEKKLIEYAALTESYSAHPISKSLQKAHGKPLDKARVNDVEEISGQGVRAQVDGLKIAAGNTRLMDAEGVTHMPCHSTGTVVHMAVDGQYAGHILITDKLKKTAHAAISALKKAGIKKTVMLTGDRENVARETASELGIDEVYAELLPGDKVAKVEALLAAQKKGETLAFVGDGINDAPVLARADVGIAMGALGSDAAIEAADVVLMDDDPAKIAQAVRLSRRYLRIVHENIGFAIAVKLLCLILSALGLTGMWTAIFADVGVMVLAVLNAIRALTLNEKGDF